MSHSQMVTPPFAAIDGSTFRLNTATTNSSTRSRLPSTRFRCARASPATSEATAVAPSLLTHPTPLGARYIVPQTQHRSQCPAAPTNCAPRSFCVAANPGATSSNTAKCLSMSASVCYTEIVHCSSHQYGCASTPIHHPEPELPPQIH